MEPTPFYSPSNTQLHAPLQQRIDARIPSKKAADQLKMNGARVAQAQREAYVAAKTRQAVSIAQTANPVHGDTRIDAQNNTWRYDATLGRGVNLGKNGSGEIATPPPSAQAQASAAAGWVNGARVNPDQPLQPTLQTADKDDTDEGDSYKTPESAITDKGKTVNMADWIAGNKARQMREGSPSAQLEANAHNPDDDNLIDKPDAVKTGGVVPAVASPDDAAAVGRGYVNAADEITQNRQAGAAGAAVRAVPVVDGFNSADVAKTLSDTDDLTKRTDSQLSNNAALATAKKKMISDAQDKAQEDYDNKTGTGTGQVELEPRAKGGRVIGDLAKAFMPKPKPMRQGGNVIGTPSVGGVIKSSPGLGGTIGTGSDNPDWQSDKPINSDGSLARPRPSQPGQPGYVAPAPAPEPVLASPDAPTMYDKPGGLRDQFNAANAAQNARQQTANGLTNTLRRQQTAVINGAPQLLTPPIQPLAKGGDAKKSVIKKYLVGEKGPEVFVPKNKKSPPSVIGAKGPQVGHFPENGTVIPNHKISAMAKEMAANSVPDHTQKLRRVAPDKQRVRQMA